MLVRACQAGSAACQLKQQGKLRELCQVTAHTLHTLHTWDCRCSLSVWACPPPAVSFLPRPAGSCLPHKPGTSLHILSQPPGSPD